MEKSFLLLPNFERNSLPSVRAATGFLREKGCRVFCEKGDENKFDAEVYDGQNIDFILVFGGDGTMIGSVKKYIDLKKPFIGVNTGKLGYLTDIEPSGVAEALDALLQNRFFTEERVTLTVTTHGATFSAVNEVALQRNEAHLISAEIAINGQLFQPLRADGVLVATPTGSTAYNLSAGGPVLMPSAKNMVITPVCAHSLSARPVVVGNGDVVTIALKAGGESASLAIDGKKIAVLTENEGVKIAVSGRTFSLLRLREGSFFGALRHKLSNWEL